MKKKTIFSLIFCMIISVCVLFTGCGETDLSDINAKIETMQQQITDLQNRLNEAEENQQDLLLDLTTANGKLATLEEQVYGKKNNYFKVNETLTYSANGIKLFDFTLTNALFNRESKTHGIVYNFNCYIDGINIKDDAFKISFMFYSQIEQKSYESSVFGEDRTNFSANIPDEIREGLVYFYVGNTITGIYQVNFVEI